MGLNRKGLRLQKKIKNKEIKNHKKEFLRIIDEIDRVAILLKDENVTEDNLEDMVALHSEIKVGKMERIIFKNKLKLYE